MTDKVRNILLFGRSGNGKSAVANVLANEVNKDETEFINFEEKFKESEFGVSETKEIQVEEFEDNVDKEGTEKIKFRIIDTVGIGDTTLQPREVMSRIAKIADIIKDDGLCRILFVVKLRFTKEEIEAYNLLRAVIFDAGIIKHTTVVRTGFPSFCNLDICTQDKKLLVAESREIAEIVNNKIIYVDNPPVNTGREDRDASNMKDRLESRKRLLTHLYACKDQFYKPSNLDSMNERISEYRTENEQNAEMIEELTKTLEEEKNLSRKEREEMAKKLEQANKEREQASERMNQELVRIMKENQENFNRAMEEQRKNYDERINSTLERVENLAREKALVEEELARRNQRDNYDNDSRYVVERERGRRRGESSPDYDSSDDYDERRGGRESSPDYDSYDDEIRQPERRGGGRQERRQETNLPQERRQGTILSEIIDLPGTILERLDQITLEQQRAMEQRRAEIQQRPSDCKVS